MEYLKAVIVKKVCEYFENDFKRIEHALEVLHYSEHIAQKTGSCDSETILAAALLHDVGIKIAERDFGKNNGDLQEKLGPPEAEKILSLIDFDSDKTKIVCDIVSNHHSPSKFDYPELAVLKEADRIVNTLHSHLK